MKNNNLLFSTENLLKTVFSEVSKVPKSNLESSVPFLELGIDSFYVLKIVKRLEEIFGPLSKTLLFENFNIDDLTNYFVENYADVLKEKFSVSGTDAIKAEPMPQDNAGHESLFIIKREADALADLEVGPIIRDIYDNYKGESSVARGTRVIAPLLFVGTTKTGYIHFNQNDDVVLAYAYTGPIEDFKAIALEMLQYCRDAGKEFNLLADEQIDKLGEFAMSATPFGAMQRVFDLPNFSLNGGKMRRLRYQVSKFEKAGQCRTEEYICGTDANVDKDIASVIDRWCDSRPKVNPLVYIAREEILAGTLDRQHRIFLTYVDDSLQNVIIISPFKGKDHGYLMDLEFYPDDMPLGGLEYAIIKIIDVLVEEGSALLSMGATLGPKLEDSENADASVESMLEGLREQQIFNDLGNLQFKNKFRPQNSSIFLCREKSNTNTDSIIDVIMMIADPDKAESANDDIAQHDVKEHAPITTAQNTKSEPTRSLPTSTSTVQKTTHNQFDGRLALLEANHYNPLALATDDVPYDLSSDSWAKVTFPEIDIKMQQLFEQLHNAHDLTRSLKAIFPFEHFVLTESGRTAEAVLCESWPNKGMVPQNILFPTWIFSQIQNDFEPVEMPSESVFEQDCSAAFIGGLNLDKLRDCIHNKGENIAFVCVEVSNNAAGGSPISLSHLEQVQALLQEHNIPLVMDATRIIENAHHVATELGMDIWDAARRILSCADMITVSLAKDFGVNKGGLIATNDQALAEQLSKVAESKGVCLDVIDKKLIAAAMSRPTLIQNLVQSRIESAEKLSNALVSNGMPVIYRSNSHCIIVDVKQIAVLQAFANPVESFVAWLFLKTGIRAGSHSVGMQKDAAMSGLVRIAVPVGLSTNTIDEMVSHLASFASDLSDIPEVVAAQDQQRSSLLPEQKRYTLAGFHHCRDGSDYAADVKVESKTLTNTSSQPTQLTSHKPEQYEAKASKQQTGDIEVNTDIAIIGMAGRYPSAKNVDELWENLIESKDCITDLPGERIEQRLKSNKLLQYRGGFISDIDKFDSLFFNISPREAEMLDPQERLFLEVAYEAIENAGYYPEILSDEQGQRNIGVYVGAVWAMYQQTGQDEKASGNLVNPNSFLWSIANRVSYWMNLSGPSMTIDTACSSSLTSIYLAVEGILNGECSSAIAGGVNLDLHQSKQEVLLAGGTMSPDGVCRSFGQGANGYVAGEGVGAIYLKSLEQAKRDNDHIYGVIKSAVVNHGGRSGGYTVPNPNAQRDLITKALEKGKVDARTIGYIEAHGTGTELGDPIEIKGLNSAFATDQVIQGSCPVGSVKSNIGHLEAAAGIVSVCKVLMQMRHKTLVPSLHSNILNEHIEFDKSPFYIQQKVEPWLEKTVDGTKYSLRAGISSFGAGGANAHVIIEHYEQSHATRTKTENELTVFPLSARSEEQLKEVAQRLHNALNRSLADSALADLSYTLKVRRKPFEHRVAILASSLEELKQHLNDYVEGNSNHNVVAGKVLSTQGVSGAISEADQSAFAQLLLKSNDPFKLAQLWVEGFLFDWQGFVGIEKGATLPLPTYPFADKRHWVPISDKSVTYTQGSTIHPLLDVNESTFERQLFQKSFADNQFYIYDHLVSEIPTLPGVAYLELARSAAAVALGRKVTKIHNILWVSPLTVKDETPTNAKVELKLNNGQVQFEVFQEQSEQPKQLFSQGRLSYQTELNDQSTDEYIDIDAIRNRTRKVIEGEKAYPLFKELGLYLGPSFQVLKEVYKNETEALGRLVLPQDRMADLESFILHPSLVDGSLQVAMASAIGDNVEQLFVPYTIGEVEILHPLVGECYSYVTSPDAGKKSSSKLSNMDVVITDATGKVLVKIKECVGVPLTEVHEKDGADEACEALSYAPVWHPTDMVAKDAAELESVLLFENDSQPIVPEGVTQVIRVKAGEAFSVSGPNSYTVNPDNAQDYEKLFSALLEAEKLPKHICFAWGIGEHVDLESSDFSEDEFKQATSLGVDALFNVSKILITQKLVEKIQLLYVNVQAQSGYMPLQEAILGFARSLRLESSKLSCKYVELASDSHHVESIWPKLRDELTHFAGRVEAVRYVDDQRFTKETIPTAQNVFAAPQGELGTVIKNNGTYLISGGAGGLGLIVAEHLAKYYQANLVLLGRSALSEQLDSTLDALRQLGSQVRYYSADIACAEQVAEVTSDVRQHFGKIDGVLHAAGCLRDSYLRDKSLEDLHTVLRPKALGAINLDRYTQQDELDFFVLFSSMSAVGGNAGQCDYSYANYYLDAFAAKRTLLSEQGQRSGKTLSFNWSIWSAGGMQIDEQTALFFKNNLGIVPLSVKTGLDALVNGLSAPYTQLAIMEGDRKKVEQVFEFGLPSENIAELESVVDEGQVDAAEIDAHSGLDSNLTKEVLNQLTQLVVEFLKLEPSDITADKILLDLGFDSIGLTSFANMINDVYGLNVTPVLFFEYPTLKEVTACLVDEHHAAMVEFHGATESSTSQSAEITEEHNESITLNPVQSLPEIRSKWHVESNDTTQVQIRSELSALGSRFVEQPIAIVGMSGSMPKSADLDEYWDNLVNAVDMIDVIPADRWDWKEYFGDPMTEENKSNSKWGGFMKEIDKFDSLFFGISPHEAEYMDPQQRLFLECVWAAIEDSGHKVSDIAGTKTGLFVGAATNDYVDLMSVHNIGIEAYTSTGNSHSVLANRVSYLLGIHGPSAPLDTACSSSLVAIHRALESLHCGSCDMAIAGGVQVMASPSGFITFSKAGMLSNDGRCKTFDSRANGYVRGEGVGAIFLKPLEQAINDGNPIHAIIKGTGENHGGKANALTAPNPNAQSELLIGVYEKAQVDPARIGFIECHGTGTSLGDPIEIQGLKRTFSELYKRAGRSMSSTPHCAIGSAKSNIGHLETAAGIAGVLKLVLALKNKTIPASLHIKEVNPYIDLNKSPLYVATESLPWPAIKDEQGNDLPRIGGVSSFGFGGANAHIALEEYIEPSCDNLNEQTGPFIVPLSAKSQNSLQMYAIKLEKFLSKAPVDMRSLAYTFQVGRDVMKHRLCIVADDQADLINKLAKINTGQLDCDNVFSEVGSTLTDKFDTMDNLPAFLTSAIGEQDWPTIAEAWMYGADIDWMLLYSNATPKRMSVPTYPFQRIRHWVVKESHLAKKANGEIGTRARLHPVVTENTSTLMEQKFTTRFTGQEFYLADHVIDGKKVLPGVAYMEIARKVGELSLGTNITSIKGITWLRPYIYEPENNQIDTVVLPENGCVEFNIKDPHTQTVLCRGALGYQPHEVYPEPLDINAIKSRCPDVAYDHTSLYEYLCQSIDLGEGFKVVQSIHASKTEALSVLSIPSHLQGDVDEYWLHPSVMDGSLHTGMGLLKQNNLTEQLRLPFSVSDVKIYRPVKDLYYAYASWTESEEAGTRDRLNVNVTLLNKQGEVLVHMHNFISLPFDRKNLGKKDAVEHLSSDTEKALASTAKEESLNMFAPVWEVLPQLETSTQIPTSAEQTYLVCTSKSQHKWFAQDFPGSQKSYWEHEPTEEDIQHVVESEFSELVWVAPDVSSHAQGNELALESIAAQQAHGVVALFRLVKALLNSEKSASSLKLTVITQNSVQVNNQTTINPCHSGVIGFIGSLAKECPHWDLRMLDIEAMDKVQPRQCMSRSFNEEGDVQAYRDGEWLGMSFGEVNGMHSSFPVYKEGGVYVVVGGAGGLGELWSRYMIEQYNAKIVWLGRREQNAEISEKCEALAQLGVKPLYFSVDASDLEQLNDVFKCLTDIYPNIDGVVHSAIVLDDSSIARMTLESFQNVIDAKVSVSTNIASVFGECDLDFMLFFSSIVSFFKTPGQSNYAAGCTFKDVFASALLSAGLCATKVINWGYWGNVGVVADESYRQIMQSVGIGSIEKDEGLAALETLMSSDFSQVGLIKTLNDTAYDSLNIQSQLPLNDHPAAQLSDSLELLDSGLSSSDRLESLEQEYNSEQLDKLAGRLLAATLQSQGIDLEGDYQHQSPFEHAPDFYLLWLRSSIDYLRENKLLEAHTPEQAKQLIDYLWVEWQNTTSAWSTNPNRKAQITLLESCLKGLPDILAGKKLATEVMFPNSSMQLVEGIYKDNVVADFFNETLKNVLKIKLDELQSNRPERPIRILEVGAGTGGTTSRLIPLLQQYEDVIGEYCYTDISKAFLIHAQKQFGDTLPGLNPQIFDASKPLAQQNIDLASYDVVIATNVLHATSNIRNTIRNVKAVMAKEALLLLNEISTWTLFGHLTFGLLEGWWLYEDEALRIPGNPGLYPDGWNKVLSNEGFYSVQFPVKEAVGLGQQIIVAHSDGLIKQHKVSGPKDDSKQTVLGTNKAKVAATQVSAEPVIRESKMGEQVASKQPSHDKQSTHVFSENNMNNKIQNEIKSSLSKALKIDESQIQNDTSFADYGVDSIIGVSLIRSINEALNIDMETVVLFEYTNVEQLAKHIVETFSQVREVCADAGAVEQVSAPIIEPVVTESHASVSPEANMFGGTRFFDPSSTSQLPAVSEHNQTHNVENEHIAIIGMSGRFGDSKTLEEFWEHIQNGDELLEDITRWSLPNNTPEQDPTRYKSSFITDIDKFDAPFFRIADQEATYMDPQQRIFLEESWKAVENAGYAAESLSGTNCGVYVGCGSSHYHNLFGNSATAESFWGNSESVLPTRIAYQLNLKGPAIAIETACSSSMVATHLACQALMTRETDLALAGGIFLQPTMRFYQLARQAGMISSTGSCRSFCTDGDGFIPSEGVGVLMLKRVSDALRDKDHIHGVIIASGINQDGSSNGIISPSVEAQISLMESVYERFDVDPMSIQLIEAHGTGTALGDSIEHRALKRVYEKAGDKTGINLGSIKMNIGHTMTAAGVAGILKLLLAMKHNKVPPAPAFANGNGHMDIAPFEINTELQEWETVNGAPKRAAVSAFAFNGTNAHIVLEEPPKPVVVESRSPAHIFVLSARTESELRQKVVDMSAILNGGHDFSLQDIAFTLLTGRSAFEYRLAFIADSQMTLSTLLDGWLSGRRDERIFENRIGNLKEQVSLKNFGNYCVEQCVQMNNQSTIDVELYVEHLSTVADLFVKGYKLGYDALCANGARRVPLPAYPFNGQRYWVETQSLTGNQSEPLVSAQLHPLLHRNDSNLQNVRFNTTFKQRSQYVLEQRGNKEVLPNTQLAMSLLAFSEVSQDETSQGSLKFTDVRFGTPARLQGDSMELVTSMVMTDDNRLGVEIHSDVEGSKVIHHQSYALVTDEYHSDLDGLQIGIENFKQKAKVNTFANGNDFYELNGDMLKAFTASENAKGVIDILADVNSSYDLIADCLLLLESQSECSASSFSIVKIDELYVHSLASKPVYLLARLSSHWTPDSEDLTFDVDLLDEEGLVCVEITALTLQQNHADSLNSEYIFTRKDCESAQSGELIPLKLSSYEKVTLFMKSQLATQLSVSVDDISTDINYIELGASSFGLAEMIQNINTKMDLDVLPSALFEYVTISSFSDYLADNFDAQIAQLMCFKKLRESQADKAPVFAELTPFTRGQANYQVVGSEKEASLDNLLDQIKVDDDSGDDSTPTMTF